MNNLHRLTPEMLKIFEILPDRYLILSPELIILAASKAHLQSTRKTKSEVLGKHFFVVFPDKPNGQESSSLTALEDSFQQVLATKKPHTIDVIRYDIPRTPEQGGGQDTRYWQAINTPVLDEREELLYILHKGIDITEQVQTEQNLIASQLREQAALEAAEHERIQLHNLFMQAPALICIFEGPQHVFTLVNPPYQSLVGDRPLLGRPIAEAMPELAGQPIFDLLDEVYRTGKSFHAYEMLVQLDHTNQGQLGENYYNFVYQATRNLAGEIDGILVFAYEVTAQVNARKKVEALNEELSAANDKITASHNEQRLANEELITTNEELSHTQNALRQLNEELEKRVNLRTRELLESNQQLEETLKNLHDKNFELDQFVYRTSHDLRAPLSTILGLITILKGEESEATKAQYIDLMENRVHKLDKFIKSMLDYSRNARTETSFMPIRFTEFIYECLQELQQVKHFDRLRLEICIDEGDPFRLKIVITNLISNAIKYQDFNKSKSYLTIDVNFYPTHAAIVIEDNGVGIDEKYQHKLFNMFFRASDQSEGSGLGLYIVKQAVAKLKGSITFQSNAGQGTKFEITIPTRK
jgi:signal transduction histidine kinase